MATQEHRRKAAAQTGLYIVVIAAIAVLANVLGAKLYHRWDATRNERYTLSAGSGRLVRSLSSPIQVDAYVKRGLPQLDAFVSDLTDLLKEYERAGDGKFKFTIIEPNTDALRAQAKEAGLTETPFGEANQTGEDQASITQGYMGLVLKYGSEKAVIPQIMQADGLEFWITNKIREIRDKADNIKHRIGVVTGKDELKLTDTNLIAKQGRGGGPSMQGIIEQAFPFYKLEALDLKGGAEPIDKDLVGIIITQPQKDYDEKELRRIDQFLMLGGKSLVVYASAVSMKPNDASMSATLNLHGLDKLLPGYGITMNKDAVLDYGAQFRLPAQTQTGQIVWIRHPGIAHVENDPRLDSASDKTLDTSFAGFFRMDEAVFPFPSSLTLDRSKQPADVKITAVARTSPQTSVDTAGVIDMKMRKDWDPKPPMSQRVIAATVVGKLKSAFAGKPGDGITAPERAPSESRVLVISSSEFLTNPFAYAGNGPELGGQFQMLGAVGGDPQLLAIAQPYTKYLTSTILSLKNTLDWMAGDSDLVASSAKLIGDPNLSYTSISKPKFKAGDDEAEAKRKDEMYRSQRKTIQTQVQWTLAFGMPVAFALFGLLRWRRRQARRDLLKI